LITSHHQPAREGTYRVGVVYIYIYTYIFTISYGKKEMVRDVSYLSMNYAE